MYAPDESVARLHKLSPTAIELYFFHCQWRDHYTGYSRKSKDRAAAELGLSRTTAYRAYKNLLDEDFLSETKDGRIGLRGGSFAPYDKTPEARAVWFAPALKAAPKRAQNLRLNFERPALAGSKVETENGFNVETECSKVETNCSNIETTAYIERARVCPSILPSSFPSDTHTHNLESQPARARDATEAPSARVCVSIRNSRHTDGEIRRYAQAFGLGMGWETEARRTGEWDADVEAYLRPAPEAIAAARAAPVETWGLAYAATVAQSLLEAGHDPLPQIREMPVTDDVRARLVERFCNSPPEKMLRQAGGS